MCGANLTARQSCSERLDRAHTWFGLFAASVACIYRRSILSPKGPVLASTVFILEAVPVFSLGNQPYRLLACLSVSVSVCVLASGLVKEPLMCIKPATAWMYLSTLLLVSRVQTLLGNCIASGPLFLAVRIFLPAPFTSAIFLRVIVTQ